MRYNYFEMKSKSFTLVETIVVITIFAIIAAGVSASFISGMKIWARARDVGFVQSRILLSLEQIAAGLRQCVNISQIGFNGTGQEFSFPAVSAGSVGRVKYGFDAAAKTVFLRFQSLEDILAAQEESEDDSGVEFKERKMFTADSFCVSYFYFDEEEDAHSWVDGWQKESGIFGAVKIETGVQNDKFEKVIFVPIAESSMQDETPPPVEGRE